MSILRIKGLRVQDLQNQNLLVRDLGFELAANTCLGIVGESGSGKTLACTSMLGLADPGLAADGEVWFEDVNLLTAPAKTLRQIRGTRICMILQNPMTAFDPLYPMGKQMVEVLCQKTGLSGKKAKTSALESLEKMQIQDPEAALKKYPHQLSGGMLQRCMIALTLALEPDLIIADEPTTALDAINQQEVINSFIRLQKITGTAMIFISHDLGAVGQVAQEVLVMQKGCQVEYGSVKQIFEAPNHPYTKYLINTRDALTRSFRQAMGIQKEAKAC